jgi:hypothetical protein
MAILENFSGNEFFLTVKRHRCMPDIWGVLDKMYCQKERA